ncbi:MAG: class I tRNA ligase family protein, partial [Clostridia bacterium]|nr:class I tRNA ligase family protein [Clostridia bacterium]
MKELEKNFNPQSVEKSLYRMWREKGYFKPSNDRKKETFTIVIPPPNVTGQLHMGHALDETLQDILIRYKRMKGYAALWVPGTDHAGIATQIK